MIIDMNQEEYSIPLWKRAEEVGNLDTPDTLKMFLTNYMSPYYEDTKK